MRAPLLAIAAVSVLCCACSESSQGPPFIPVSPSTTPPVIYPRTGGPSPGPAVELGVGERFDGVVTYATDPACYPNWDASGRCRTLSVVAPRDGELTVRLEWQREGTSLDLMDLFVVHPDGNWDEAFSGVEHEELHLPVQGGQRYYLLAFSVGRAQLAFSMTVEM